MARTTHLRPHFVESFPTELEDGVLYVSMQFATASHRCCCGCGNEVVTPLTPTDWKLTFDGETVSLDPSIGNWSFSCRSHYWIRRNAVRWSTSWSNAEVEAGRAQDRLAKDQQFRHPPDDASKKETPPSPTTSVTASAPSRLTRFWRWIRGR